MRKSAHHSRLRRNRNIKLSKAYYTQGEENRLQEIVKRKDDIGILEFDYNAFAE
jgi:hypothetical protein